MLKQDKAISVQYNHTYFGAHCNVTLSFMYEVHGIIHSVKKLYSNKSYEITFWLIKGWNPIKGFINSDGFQGHLGLTFWQMIN